MVGSIMMTATIPYNQYINVAIHFYYIAADTVILVKFYRVFETMSV